MSKPHCPNPHKVGYATLRGAAHAAVEYLNVHFVSSRPYVCECGDYHLTTKGLNGAPLTAEMVQQLFASVG